MKKIIGIILAGAMALSMGTQAFAAGTNNGNRYGWENGKHNPHKFEVTAGTNNGNHYGWEKGKHNPHKSEVTPPENVEETDSYDNLPFGVTDEAIALDRHRVDWMAEETTIQAIEADFNSGSNTAYLDIIGIKVLDGQLVYVISNDINPNNFPASSKAAHLLVNALGYEQLHFMLPQEFEISSLFYVEGASVFMTDYKQPLYPYDILPFGVTDEAIALDRHRVDLMAEETTIQAIEADFNSGSNTAYLDIIGIKVLDGQLVYVISNDINPNNFPVSSEAAHLLVNALGYEQLHFMLPQEFEISSLFYVEGASVFMTDYKQPLYPYDNLPFGVTDEAIALDRHRVDLMAEETTIQAIEADFNSGSNTAYLDIIGIKVLDGQLVYVISNDINPNNFPVSSEAAHLLVNALGYEQLHFMLPQEFEISSLFYVEGASVFMTDYKQPLL